ncbi:MAG: AAA family ATPase, partial [Proteobacteria bacterium]|nr:AAA family ATPase [Pseudomonadota bacterium]
SSVQSAAYITGEQLHESRRDLNVNYRNRHSDIAFTTTLAPEYAPKEFHQTTVWDLFENFEDTYAYQRYKTDQTREQYLNSAQTAQTIVVALPRELSVDVCHELVTQFAKDRFVSRGLVVTLAIHDDEGNPHAHLQISRRAVNENGEIAWTKDREICSKKELLSTRKLWADLTNDYLEREGYEARITEKSFADLGINLEPTQHRGWVADKLESMGVNSRIVTENAEIFENNRDVLLENPQIILPELTQNNATFTQLHLLKAIQKRVGDDTQLVAQIFEQALQESIVVGEGMDGQIRYTSPTYHAIEKQAVELSKDLAATVFKQDQIKKPTVESYLQSHFSHLSGAQHDAVIGLTHDQSFAVLIGRAGAGKTTTLKAVSDIYKEAGYTVIGASLAAAAADNLSKEAGIESSTLHRWIYQWERYHAAQEKFLSFDSVMEEGVFKQLDWYQDLKRFEGLALTDKTVLIVDEAGMVGTRLWNQLLVHAKIAGAKLIAVGDDHQFKAIEAGDFFRELKTQAAVSNTLFELNTIYRQRSAWMQEASTKFANLEIQEALQSYEHHGHVHQLSKTSLSQEIAKAYVENLHHHPDASRLVLAFTNAQVQELNQAIRQELKKEGLLPQEDSISLNGQSFTIGDRIVFLENDKSRLTITDADGVVKKGEYIKNGTQGKIRDINPDGSIQVQVSENLYTSITCLSTSTPKVAIGQPTPEPLREYAYTAIAHGYTVTAHKAQGQTVDHVLVAASKNMDAKGLYVAMTRHRDDVQLYYAKEDFSTFKALTSQLSRFEHKDLVKDYTIRPENEAAWQGVQEYRLCVLDAAAILKEKTPEGNVDWQTYRLIKQDQIRLGKEILNQFDKHQLYINQAGLTEEMLQITIGAKARPLSLTEEKAKLTVELYGETAQTARDLWRDIRKTHPGSKCYDHPSYHQFHQLRQERNDLARTITENYALHREFVGEFSRVYGISKRMVESQSRQFFEKSAQEGKTDNIQNTRAFQHLKHDATLIKQELDTHIKDLAYQFLGKPQQQKSIEWRYGNKGSISIHVAGHRQGLYSNFETGESGNALKFIQDQLNCDHKQAFKWGVEWLGKENASILSHTSAALSSTKIDTYRQQEWIPVFPAPLTPVNLQAEPQLQYMLKGRQETVRYAYKDADGNVLGYVLRLEDNRGNKITPTLTYCQTDQRETQWRWHGFGNDRPLYGLDQLKQKPEAAVLVVEGEKTAEAAKLLFPDYAVVTWSGGCGSVHKSDWSVLKDRQVVIWPDHDQPGVNAAAKITDILNKQGNERVTTAVLPSTFPHKWDLADEVPAGLDVKEILADTSTSLYLLEEKVRKENVPPKWLESSLSKEAYEKNESIINYLKTEVTLERHDWLSAKDITHLIEIAEQNPQVALQQWQSANNDYSFMPLTREQAHIKNAQAKELLIQAQKELPQSVYQHMIENLPCHAEGVIKKCEFFIENHQTKTRDADVAIFKNLCERYHELSKQYFGENSEKQSVEKRLCDIAAFYEKDQKFLQTVERINDKNIQQIASEFLQRQDLDKDRSREFER